MANYPNSFTIEQKMEMVVESLKTLDNSLLLINRIVGSISPLLNDIHQELKEYSNTEHTSDVNESTSDYDKPVVYTEPMSVKDFLDEASRIDGKSVPFFKETPVLKKNDDCDEQLSNSTTQVNQEQLKKEEGLSDKPIARAESILEKPKVKREDIDKLLNYAKTVARYKVVEKSQEILNKIDGLSPKIEDTVNVSDDPKVDE